MDSDCVGSARIWRRPQATSESDFPRLERVRQLAAFPAGYDDLHRYNGIVHTAISCLLSPAFIMSFYVPTEAPQPVVKGVHFARGAKRVIGLFVSTIVMAVSFEQFLGLPPFMGMMIGMSLLMFLTYYLRRTRQLEEPQYDVFTAVSGAKWDTLLFFFGVIFDVHPTMSSIIAVQFHLLRSLMERD